MDADTGPLGFLDLENESAADETCAARFCFGVDELAYTGQNSRGLRMPRLRRYNDLHHASFQRQARFCCKLAGSNRGCRQPLPFPPRIGFARWLRTSIWCAQIFADDHRRFCCAESGAGAADWHGDLFWPAHAAGSFWPISPSQAARAFPEAASDSSTIERRLARPLFFTFARASSSTKAILGVKACANGALAPTSDGTEQSGIARTRAHL